MAGVNQTPITSGVNWAGKVSLGGGKSMYVGTGLFVTTATTAVINHPFGTRRIYSIDPTPIAASYSANDTLFVTLGSSANQVSRDATYGTLTSNTAGKLTIQRNSGGTSGLAFSVTIIAQDA